VETKDLIGLSLLFIATAGGIGVTLVSQRARDAAFFLMAATTVITDKLDINFLSHYWYRGTTRGLEFSLVDVLAMSVLVSSLLLPRHGQARCYWPASLGVMLLFFIYACCSVLISEPKIYGLFELSKMVRGILIFLAAALFVRSERELKILMLALCCTVCFEGSLAIKQRFLDGIYRVAGSVEHENSFSMYLCLIGPVLVAAATSTLPRYLRYSAVVALAAAAVSILLTISRAGIPIFAFVTLGATVFCVSWRITAKKVAAATLIALAVAGLIAKSWDSLKERYLEATFEQEYLDDQVEGRGYYLRLAKAIMDDRFFGVGLNNWSYWVSKEYGARLGSKYEDYDDLAEADRDLVDSGSFAAPAHNLAALTIGEVGVPGLVLFALIWMRWFQMGVVFLWKRSVAALHQMGVGIFFGICGVFLQSVTEWTYRQTHILLTFHILLGVLASLYYLRREEKRRRAEERIFYSEEQASLEPAVT
jgi:hypothetical protein